MQTVEHLINFFDYISDLKLNRTLFIQKAKYVKKYHLWTRFIRRKKENLVFQLVVIEYNLRLALKYIELDKNGRDQIYFLKLSLISSRRGLDNLYHTYNHDQRVEKLIFLLDNSIEDFIKFN